MREQAVIRIVRLRIGSGRLTGLSVSMACHDYAKEVLDVPAMSPQSAFRNPQSAFHWVDKLSSEPIQQLRMHRPFALRAEVIQHFRQTCTKELPPLTIDEDARGQRVVFGH